MRVFIILLLLPFLGCSQEVNSKKSLAIEGYDPVSYFEGKAEEGFLKYQVQESGLTYRFTSTNHMKIFEANPKAYTPQYGGWCAYAMGLDGSKVEINPESYKVKDGKLYLFYKTIFLDTKSKWDKNEESLKTKADQNWEINK